MDSPEFILGGLPLWEKKYIIILTNKENHNNNKKNKYK